MNWASWLAEPVPPAFRALAKRINGELSNCHALVMRDVHPQFGPYQVWIVQGSRQDFITTWAEAQTFAGLASQGTFFDSDGKLVKQAVGNADNDAGG